MSKEEENEHDVKEPHYGRYFYISFDAMRLNDISYLSSKQTKDLMFAISDYVWGRDSWNNLINQLDTATKIVFSNIATEITTNSYVQNRYGL